MQKENDATHIGLSWICLLYLIYLCFHLIWGLHWHDVGEWIAAGWMLAPAHPPSHPLAVQWIHFSERFLCIGDIVWRGQLSSAICMMMAVFWTMRSIQIWIKIPYVSILAGLWLGILPLCWLQAIRAEVYALQTCLSAGLIWAISNYIDSERHLEKDLRYLLLSGFFLGLLAVNHTLLTVCFTLPLLVYLIYLRLHVKVWLGAFLFGCMGFVHYGFVWIRGQKGGIWGWPWITNFEDLWINLSGKIWQQQVQDQQTQVSINENIQALIRAQIKELGGWVFLILLLIVAFAIPRWFRDCSCARNKQLQGFALLLLSIVLFTLSTNFIYAYQPINPDLSGYFSACMPAFVLLLVLSLQRIHPLSYFCLPLLFLIPKIDIGDRSESHLAEKVATWYTESFHTQSVIWTSYYSNHFNLIALQGIQGWRMDLSYLFRGQRKSQDYWHRQIEQMRGFSKKIVANDLEIYLETEPSIDSTPALWPFFQPSGFFWHISQTSHMPKRQQGSQNVSDLYQLQLDLKALGLLRENNNQAHINQAHINQAHINQSQKIDLDTAYSIAYFEMEQIRLIKAILPYQRFDQQIILRERLAFFEIQFALWLDYLSEK